MAEVQQYVGGVPVADARWTLRVRRRGRPDQVTGAPFDPARLTAARRPGIDAEEAMRLAVEDPEDVDATATLAIEGRTDRLVWTVELAHGSRHANFAAVEVDAHARTVVARTRPLRARRRRDLRPPRQPPRRDQGLQRFDRRRRRSTSTAPTNPNPLLLAAAARLGAQPDLERERRRGPAVFTRTVSDQESYFTKTPGATTAKVFNEQQTYFWAQTLKTHVDEWGREPNAYGHYPVDAARAVNVEIVVNGDAGMEDDWSSDGTGSVMHGYFRSSAPRGWFSGHPSSAATVPAVFLFNSDGNSASPQFFGPEPSTVVLDRRPRGRPLHLLAVRRLERRGGHQARQLAQRGPLDGAGRAAGQAALQRARIRRVGVRDDRLQDRRRQWSHYVSATPPLRYSAMDCVNDDAYYVAWPFVQAMWRLMNNLGPDGDPIWGDDEAAIANTADLFMYSLHAFTADSTMTWDKLASACSPACMTASTTAPSRTRCPTPTATSTASSASTPARSRAA